MSHATQTELRWLDGPDAAEVLNPLIEARGWLPLNGSSNPVLTRARVAFDKDGEPEGFFVMQLVPMLGPVLVAHGADTALFRQLVADMRAFLKTSGARGWLIVAENPRIAELCREMGFRQETNPVFWSK